MIIKSNETVILLDRSSSHITGQPSMTSPSDTPIESEPTEVAEDTSIVEELPVEKQRIAKVMARAGLCSRRDAEKWVEAGRVTVNGDIIKSPALNVGSDDAIVVDGKPLPMMEPTRLWRYHKPVGLITSARDEQGRSTVFDHLPSELPRVISVGRLDINSEGLLLLTNDGELARKLELPSNSMRRVYRVRVRGTVNEKKFEQLKEGIVIDRIHYEAIDVKVDRQQGSNAWLEVTLTEGKNREIRRVMEYLGYTVNRLIRIRYGNFFLGQLPRNIVDEVSAGDVRKLLGKPAHKGAKAKPKKNRPRSKVVYKPRTDDTEAQRSGSKRPMAKKTFSKRPDNKVDTRSDNRSENRSSEPKKAFIQKRDGAKPSSRAGQKSSQKRTK